MVLREGDIIEEKIRELLFCEEEFGIVLYKGRKYVEYINPRLKEESDALVDECVARLVVERCRQRYKFDSTGTLNSEYQVMLDIKKLVLKGRFLYIV